MKIVRFFFFYFVWPHSEELLSLRCLIIVYCKFRNFRENFIFANSVKRDICDIKNSRLRHDLPISVNDEVISRGFYFHETSFPNIKPSQKFPNLQ